MTLTAVDTHPDYAVIVSDGLCYDPSGVQFWEHPDKTPQPLDGLAAAVTSSGNVHTAHFWQTTIAPDLAARSGDYDEFVARVGDCLNAVAGNSDLQCYMVGYSPRAQRFTAHVAWPALGGDWTPQPLGDGLHLTPAPIGAQPTRVEQAWLHANGLDLLPDGDPLESPASIDEWRDLIRRTFHDRALSDCHSGGPPKRMFGGAIHLTQLVRDGQHTRVIDRLAHDPDTFREMVRFTLHPLGQIGPCTCLSGERMIDCTCIQRIADHPCICDSGDTFRDCHMVDRADALQAA